jgi:flagellar basal-body rod protein FlgB
VGSFDVTQALLERALSGAALRQTALANNIANANTAGFKRSDVDFASALASALDDGASKQQLDAVDFAPVVDGTSGRADGNNVDIDAEMANLNENNVVYQTLVEVAKARLQLLTVAIGGR